MNIYYSNNILRHNVSLCLIIGQESIARYIHVLVGGQRVMELSITYTDVGEEQII